MVTYALPCHCQEVRPHSLSVLCRTAYLKDEVYSSATDSDSSELLLETWKLVIASRRDILEKLAEAATGALVLAQIYRDAIFGGSSASFGGQGQRGSGPTVWKSPRLGGICARQSNLIVF